MAAFGIGAKLRQTRIAKGLAIDDIARDTRISRRYLEAIETDDHSSLPGLVFTRGFIRQYALKLGIDPDALLAELPKPDEMQAPLPTPPAHPRAKSPYHRDRQIQAFATTAMWLLILSAVGTAAYLSVNHWPRIIALLSRNAVHAAVQAASPVPAPKPVAIASAHPANESTPEVATSAAAPPAPLSAHPVPSVAATSAPVQVSLTAHEVAWVRLRADGKTTFVGMLKPNETKEVSAAGQVNLLTGNAGGLTISLNGKTLDALGPSGQVREVRLTAEGPQLLSKEPPPSSLADQL